MFIRVCGHIILGILTGGLWFLYLGVRFLIKN